MNNYRKIGGGGQPPFCLTGHKSIMCAAAEFAGKTVISTKQIKNIKKNCKNPQKGVDKRSEMTYNTLTLFERA